MSTYTTPRAIDLGALPFPASARQDVAAGTWTVEADVDAATLKAAVDAAPDDPTPARKANEQQIRDKAAQALTANATYLALGTPTNAQNLAQIRALTRECNGLIRLVLGLLDDATGT